MISWNTYATIQQFDHTIMLLNKSVNIEPTMQFHIAFQLKHLSLKYYIKKADLKNKYCNKLEIC